jgi:hypothetical protein
MRVIVSILLLVLIVSATSAQSRRQKKEAEAELGPTSLDPLPKERHVPNEARKRTESRGPTYNSEREYYERVEAFAKTRRKNEKMLMTPQYSDPTYFGHKRPPKKRPPHKMKFCKECGIRH